MSSAIVVLVGILWFSLAAATYYHAKGHGKMGYGWGAAVALTGVFGLCFYLLSITSASETSDQSAALGRLVGVLEEKDILSKDEVELITKRRR